MKTLLNNTNQLTILSQQLPQLGAMALLQWEPYRIAWLKIALQERINILNTLLVANQITSTQKEEVKQLLLHYQNCLDQSQNSNPFKNQ